MLNPDINNARSGSFSVEEVLSYSTRWDKRISNDLVAEMEFCFAEKITTLPQMRNIPAVKGYRGLEHRIVSEVQGESGANAVRDGQCDENFCARTSRFVSRNLPQ